MPVDVLLGLQWGDEGKGKIVDYLSPYYDLVCRFQGGPNAGHTIKIKDKEIVLHTIPSGIFREDVENIIGNGVVIDPITLSAEIKSLAKMGIHCKHNLFIAKKAHLILPTHRMLDRASEAAKGTEKIGSTQKGIGPTYMDKTGRNGLRIGNILEKNFQESYSKLKEKHLGLLASLPEIEFDLATEEEKWFSAVEELRDYNFIDCEYYVNAALADGKNILAEGAQGSMLDIDYGTYPFVTSSNTITSGACLGLGIPPQAIDEVFGISKAYCTRVGSGPFPTELKNEAGALLQKYGHEFGATTGRERRCGWLDLPQLKYACMLNGVSQIVLTKVDVLDYFASFDVCTAYNTDMGRTEELPFDLGTPGIEPVYKSFDGWSNPVMDKKTPEDLPVEVRKYIEFISKALDIPVTLVSTGPERDSLIKYR